MRAARSRAEVSSFAIPHDFSHTTRANIAHEKAEQIRARIVCTPAESAWRGLTHMRSMCVGVAETGHRGSDAYADGTTVINLILLCSHPDAHPNLNREVRHSLTWHSSKSESALERFEPVAVVKLRSDGSLAMFAPEGDGCLQRAKREDAGRFSKEGKSLDDFFRAFRQ